MAERTYGWYLVLFGITALAVALGLATSAAWGLTFAGVLAFLLGMGFIGSTLQKPKPEEIDEVAE